MKKPHTNGKGRTFSKSGEALITEHDDAVARMYTQGFTQYEIGQKVGLSQGAISKIIARVLETWRARTMDNVQLAIFGELEGLSRAEAIAWEEWEFSRVKQVVVKPEKGAKNQKPEVQTIRVEGNPVWHEQAMKCKKLRLEVLGAVGNKTTNVLAVKAEAGSQVSVDPEFWTKLYTPPTEECPVEAEILKVKALPAKQEEDVK